MSNPFPNNPHYKHKGKKAFIPIKTEQEIITQELNKIEVTAYEPKKRQYKKRVIVDDFSFDES